jgi:hypothetical protein
MPASSHILVRPLQAAHWTHRPPRTHVRRPRQAGGRDERRPPARPHSYTETALTPQRPALMENSWSTTLGSCCRARLLPLAQAPAVGACALREEQDRRALLQQRAAVAQALQLAPAVHAVQHHVACAPGAARRVCAAGRAAVHAGSVQEQDVRSAASVGASCEGMRAMTSGAGG